MQLLTRSWRNMTRTADLLAAIGDLHGHAPALDRLLAALDRRHAILAKDGSLREGVRLVFTGDYIDRGTGGLAVIERIERIERLARASRGHVVTLLGNHELMALEALDAAAVLADEDDLEGALVAYEHATLHGRNGGGAFVREFGSPRDALRSYVRRMARTGDVGRWLRRLEPLHLACVGDARVLFMHGDLPESLRSRRAFARYQRQVGRALGASTRDAGGAVAKWGDPALGDDDTIFWSRSFARLDAGDEPAAARICRSVGVDCIVTGHTPHDEITCYGGRIFDLDVGMTPAYGENEPQALVLEGGRATAFSASGDERRLGVCPLALRAA